MADNDGCGDDDRVVMADNNGCDDDSSMVMADNGGYPPGNGPKAPEAALGPFAGFVRVCVPGSRF